MSYINKRLSQKVHFVCKEKLGVVRRSNGEVKYKSTDGRRKEAEGTVR